MCGIAGVWVQKRPPGDSNGTGWVASMLDRLVHRGPDAGGSWSDPARGVVLGHRRLSVLDVSELGSQPMVADTGAVVAFNGEIYNFPELRAELEGMGERFHSRSDTEVLLKGYVRWGRGVLDRLVGMYAFAIWDPACGELFLGRDRAGEKPLYYSRTPWGFAFASELGALEGLPDLDTTLDRDALALYLSHRYVPAPHSMLAGVRKLPAGHWMRVDERQAWSGRYWDPVPLAFGERLVVSPAEAADRLDELLQQAVRGQMLSDVPLGAFLSGGVDSSAVVSAMAQMSDMPVRTFTIGFQDPEYDESANAERVARHLGTEHTVDYFTEQDVLERITDLPSTFGEPFGDASALPTRLVSEIARRQVTVALSGDGGDELFGGYTSYRLVERIARASALLGPAAPLARAVFSRMPGKVGRAGRLLGRPAEELHRGIMSAFGATQVEALVGKRPGPTEFERAWSAPRHSSLTQSAMLADMVTYLPDNILVKVDRSAMACSLETRAPFLDHRLMEFVLRLGPVHVQNKSLLRAVLHRRVPQAFFSGPKRGFGIPLRRWFRGGLRPLLLDSVTPERMRAVGIVNFQPVETCIREHLNGTADHGHRLWLLLMLALWSEGRVPRTSSRAA